MDKRNWKRWFAFPKMRTTVKTYGTLILWHFATGSIGALGKNLIDWLIG